MLRRMNARTPARPRKKATRAEKYKALHALMTEPEDVVHFPVAFGRIAVNFSVGAAIVLGLLAVGVLSSTVFMMRDEVKQLSGQLTNKDRDLTALSAELQKVRDQMFGTAPQAAEQGIGIQLVNAETGSAKTLSGVTLAAAPYPLRPESRAVNGKYLYWTDVDGILRVNLQDGTTFSLVSRRFVSSLAVSKDGTWLAYAYSQGLSDSESVRKTHAVVMPLMGRGDPIELGELAATVPGGIPTILGFSSDGKELLWTTMSVGEGTRPAEWVLHHTRIVNGQAGASFSFTEKPSEVFLDFSPDGSVAVFFEGKGNEEGGFEAQKLIFVNAAGKRTVRYTFPAGSLVGLQTSWSFDGSSLILTVGDAYQSFSLKGTAAPITLGKVVASGEIAGWTSDANAVVLVDNTQQ